jgi:L-threonylcarbamoyladenylate synthase
MQILKLTPKNYHNIINQAVKVLKNAGLVIYPTETCYGAGVDATNQTAVDKLLRYKTKRQGKPLSIAVANQTMAAKYVHLNPTAKNLYQKFLPGPLTVISKSRGRVASGVESATATLGIRIPDYPLVIDIVRRLGKPITATSANVSYKKRPYSIQDILDHTSKKQQALIDLIIDAGRLPKHPPSTVVDTTLDDPLILRQGSSPLRSGDIQKLISKSPQETINLAQTLMLKYWNDLQKKPLMFLLIGPLGAGKTQFAKGIGQFLQIPQPITSPTYTIEREYDYHRHGTKGKFLHLDTWRLQNIAELHQLNLATRLQPKTVIAIEWANRTLKPLLQLAQTASAKIIAVKLKLVKSHPTHRRLTLLTDMDLALRS